MKPATAGPRTEVAQERTAPAISTSAAAVDVDGSLTAGLEAPSTGGASVFVPAATAVVGDRDVLDALPERRAVAMVREQVLDVVSSEGPVELGRLVRIVGRRFGLQTVRAGRLAAIQQLVPRLQVRKSKLGVFVWPKDIDPASWTGYRSADAELSRTLDEVAPEEIANAMRALLRENPALAGDDLLRATAEVFGVMRLGALVRERLEGVLRGVPR
jgi:hypothetical protein